MYQLIYVITSTVKCMISVLQILMMIRAVLSWIPNDSDSRIDELLYTLTEPVIMPVRILLDRLGLFEGIPIDMSFFFTFILLSVIEMFL